MDQAALTDRLKQILGQIVAASGSARVKEASDLDPKADFSVLGINSVDLMEFVLRIENELRVDVLQDLAPDDLPTTIQGWAQLIAQQMKGPASPS